MPTCSLSGQSFDVSELGRRLREKLHAPEPDRLPKYRFQELAAFWKHFSLHQTTCATTGKEVISPFGPDCPYPVWHKDHWVEHADPPGAALDFSKPFFDQLWAVFQKSPIPHNIGLGNQNCEYADDWWYSKDCYLCHSGVRCEGCSYCYRTLDLKDCMHCVFAFESELCTDLIYSRNCYNVNYALFSRNCRDSSFLFDCQNCSDCLYCWNLRNKRYCIANKQYSKEEYEREKARVLFASRAQYVKTKATFAELITTQVW